jgi:hypothetical protein
VRAQRISSVGTTVDVVGGVEENPQVLAGPFGGSGERVGSYSVYPSVIFNSQTEHAVLTLDYAYGWNRLDSNPPLDSNSHIGSAAFSKTFSPRWSTKMAGTFSWTNDARTMYALRGVLPTEDPTIFLVSFDPVATHSNALTLTSGASFDHPLSTKSTVSFGGSFYHRNYETGNVRSLSDQHGFNGDVGYSRKISEHTTWDLQYDSAYYNFASFSGAVSNVVRFGVSSEIAKGTVVGARGGISHVKSIGGDASASYEAAANLNKSIKDNIVILSVSQDYGHPNGFSSVSRNRQASVGLSRGFGRHVGFFANASVFDSQGVLDNNLDSRGGNATANLGFSFTQSLSLHIGAQLQRYTKPVELAFTQKRVFASLRYTRPNLIHTR